MIGKFPRAETCRCRFQFRILKLEIDEMILDSLLIKINLQ